MAIAITLLVLPLVELTTDLGPDETVEELFRSHRSQFWSFLLSFAVIAALWLGQHRIMAHVVRGHRRLTEVLLLWSLTIVFLPFPTALVASPMSDQTATKALYAGTVLLSSGLLLLLDLVISRHAELRDGAGPPVLSRALITSLMLLLALLLMVLVPATGYYPMLLLLAVGPIQRLAGRGVGDGE